MRKTITLSKLFTREQLKAAAVIFRDTSTSDFVPHGRLVALLEQDRARFDKLGANIGYIAYVLEWKRDEICAAFPEEKP